MQISLLVKICNAKILAKSISQNNITTLVTDTRKISDAGGALFVCLSSASRDGHSFVKDAYAKGVRNFLVSKPIKVMDANVLLVADTLLAMQQIAAEKRRQAGCPVVAITGSNGKTIVKEWLAHLLSVKLKVTKSPRSYNSQIGVPLSVWNLSENDQMGIIEAGISTTNEMQRLHAVINPDFGIFTNIGPAHDEGFDSRKQKITEKIRLFDGVKALILCADKKDIYKEALKATIPLVTWSVKIKDASVYISEIKRTAEGTTISGIHTGKKAGFSFRIPFTDDASVENAINCWTFITYYFATKEWESFVPHFMQLPIVEMRLQLKEGINDCTLIDDTYSNDMAGLENALEFQARQLNHDFKTVIISDLLQTGESDVATYTKVARLLQNRKINKVIGIGASLYKHSHLFKGEKHFYTSTASFIKNITKHNFRNEIILVKGARSFGFEKITEILQKKQHGTVLKINLDALENNLQVYKSKLNAGTKLMVMVKAFSYGAGTYEIANWLQFRNIDYLGVAYADEGILLREKGIRLPIMIMNPEASAFAKMIEYKLEPVIYSHKIFDELAALPIKKSDEVKIHVELDSGMHRLGFQKNELKALAQKLNQHKKIKLAGFYSHLLGSDEKALDAISEKQIKEFSKSATELEKNIGYKVIKHILNSGGISAFKHAQFDMVRLGIGLYGVDPRGATANLQQVGTLRTGISQVFKLKKGDTVGYNQKGKLKKNSTIATIGIGYADGYDRRFGNGNGKVLVNGKFAPTVGNICMDMTMVDVSGIQVQEGDEVIVFGDKLPVTELAKHIGTIPYEILTNVSQRVKRVFYSTLL